MADLQLGASKSPKESLKQAAQLVQKALDLDESLPQAHYAMATILMVERQYEKAIDEAKSAVALSPNHANAHAMLARILHYAGRNEEALASIKKALRLDPIPPDWFYICIGSIHQYLGRYEESVDEIKKALHRNPDSLYAHIRLAATYGMLGDEAKGRAEVAEVLRLNPKFSLEHVAKTWPFKQRADLERFINALRKAGLPGGYPGQRHDLESKRNKRRKS